MFLDPVTSVHVYVGATQTAPETYRPLRTRMTFLNIVAQQVGPSVGQFVEHGLARSIPEV